MFRYDDLQQKTCETLQFIHDIRPEKAGSRTIRPPLPVTEDMRLALGKFQFNFHWIQLAVAVLNLAVKATTTAHCPCSCLTSKLTLLPLYTLYAVVTGASCTAAMYHIFSHHRQNPGLCSLDSDCSLIIGSRIMISINTTYSISAVNLYILAILLHLCSVAKYLGSLKISLPISC